MKSMTEKKSEIGSVMKKGAHWKTTQASTIKFWQITKQEFEIKGNQLHTRLEIQATVLTVDVGILSNNVLLLEKCRKCKKKNHWVKFCLSSTPTRIIKAVNKEDSENCYVIEVIEETNQADGNLNEVNVLVKIHGSEVKIALDTGAEVDAMPDRVPKKVTTNNKTQILKIQPTKRKLMDGKRVIVKTDTGSEVDVLPNRVVQNSMNLAVLLKFNQMI